MVLAMVGFEPRLPAHLGLWKEVLKLVQYFCYQDRRLFEPGFANISWFCDRLWKIIFHLKALQTRMQIDVNNFFIAQVVPESSAKNTSFKISWMCFFVTHCIFVLNHNFLSNPRKQKTIISPTKDYSLYRSFPLSQNSWSVKNIPILKVL